MAEIRVALPLLRGKRRFHILKGRPWSAIEHLLLQSLVARPSTVSELVAESDLPRRVVIEMIVRLMRVGWVQVASNAKGSTFSATDAGVLVSEKDDLPSARKSTKRWIAFYVDQLTGSPFRSYELQAIPRRRLDERPDRSSIFVLEPEEALEQPEPSELLDKLTDEDEEIIGFEAGSHRLSRFYALLLVRNGRVEGLPYRVPAKLTDLILAATKQAPLEGSTVQTGGATSPTIEVRKVDPAPSVSNCTFALSDLVLGGDAHREAFRTAVSRAHTRIVVHSTFVSQEGLDFALPLFKHAATRGVQTDVLWGQGDNTEKYLETLSLIRRINDDLRVAGLDGFITLHNFSTQSHAKILVADDLARGRFSAVVGSCNWLSTGYASFDASVRCRDPQMVASVFDALARLSQGREGHWNKLTGDLSRYAFTARGQSKLPGLKVPMALVLGPGHAHYVRTARDEANQRIFVASHRLSEVGKRAVLLPAVAAAQGTRGVAARIYFNRSSGNLSPDGASELVVWSHAEGVKLKAVYDPRLHAKILAWDDDSAVVTSQNWLSSDGSIAQPLQEIGVFVGGARAADHIVRVFDNAHLE
ncbi:hypothetical protein DWG18_04780 [Lysobacter sp. TY2-98]|uniref:hypothetical protein n=1 Tax=Lysobacter sp. TY2-98 TaxID=2290922 RepID=UPI000E209A57|nr:hypothetical protein [Lysobacter sp. TY2-98]AXK71672.1 hypothetical protein DWG18_04780 [Lysobacter sp. TY2-98]